MIGALALARRGVVHLTQDVDVLMTAQGLEHFRQKLVGLGYAPAFPGVSNVFHDTQTRVRIDVLTSGEYPGDGKPKPVAFPDPKDASEEVEGLRVLRLPQLVELKLASGMSAPQRLRDLADVQDLIATLNLPLDWAEQLDPSVRDQYRRLWHAVHGDIS